MTHDRQHRISRITTIWTNIRQAHSTSTEVRQPALAEFFERYSPAVYAYLAKLLGNADQADEAFQDFALKMIKGGFRGATADRGRFRSYLKTALIRFTIDLRRKRAGNERPLPDDVVEISDSEAASPDLDATFLESWRQEILERTWEALHRAELETSQPCFQVLRLRSENPNWSSGELAANLTKQVQPPKAYNDAQVRKLLQRARARFANLLIDEVSQLLASESLQRIEQELMELGLLEYCRSTLQQRMMQS